MFFIEKRETALEIKMILKAMLGKEKKLNGRTLKHITDNFHPSYE